MAAKGALRGLGAGLKTAGGAIATAVVGEGAVKSFLGAKGDAQGKENEAGKKKYDAAKTKAFNEKREERLSKATEVMNEKQEALNRAVGDLNGAAENETQANQQLGAARQDVVDARAAVDGGVEAAVSSDAAVQASQSTIDTATQANQSILDRYSKKYGTEIKSIDDLRGIQPTTAQGRTQLEKDIKAFEANTSSIQTANATIASRRDAIESASGANGSFGNLFTTGPLKGMAGASYTETMKTIKEKRAEQQAIIDSKGPDSQEGRAAQQQLNELTSAQKTIEGVGAATYTAAAQTRQDQVRLNEAEAAVQVAEQRVAEAPERTKVAKARVELATQAYQNAAQFVAKHDSEAFKANNQQQYTWDPAMKGSERRRIRAQDRRKAAVQERVSGVTGAATRGSKGAGETNKTIQDTDYTKRAGTAASYDDAIDGGAIARRAGERYEQATQAFTGDTEVAQFLEAHNVQPGANGRYNVRSMNAMLARDTTLSPDQKKSIKGKISTYGQAVATYNNTMTEVGRMDTIGQQTRTTEQQVVNNTQRLQVLQNQGAVVTQVIGAANNGTLDPHQLTTREIRTINSHAPAGARISRDSTVEEVRTAAENAQTRIRSQQVDTIGQNSRLAEEHGQLKKSFDDLIGRLAREINGMAINAPQGQQVQTTTPGAAPANPAVEAPVQSQVKPVPSAFEPFAAMANKGTNLSEADYERIQSEGVRANQALLNQIREQNKGIINTVEDIEREVKSDS